MIRAPANYAIVLLAVCTAAAQQNTRAAVAADDPELYFAFFSLHQAQVKVVADAKTAEGRGVKGGGGGSSEVDSASLHSAFVRELGIGEADYQRVSGIAASALAKIDVVNQDVAKLRDEILAARAAGQMRPNSDDHAKATALQDFALRYRPARLIDAIWQRFAEEIAGMIACARCPAPKCGRWFLKSDGRNDRTTAATLARCGLGGGEGASVRAMEDTGICDPCPSDQVLVVANQR